MVNRTGERDDTGRTPGRWPHGQAGKKSTNGTESEIEDVRVGFAKTCFLRGDDMVHEIKRSDAVGFDSMVFILTVCNNGKTIAIPASPSQSLDASWRGSAVLLVRRSVNLPVPYPSSILGSVKPRSTENRLTLTASVSSYVIFFTWYVP